MLKTMRRGADIKPVRYTLYGLLLAAAIGLGVSSGSSLSTMGASNNVVAKVAGVDVDIRNFDQLARRVLVRQGIDARTAYQVGIMNQILDAQVNDILLARAAHDLGLYVDDAMVTEQIRRLVAPYATGGVSARQAMEGILRSQNMTEAQFIQTLRAEMSNTLIQNALTLGSSLPMSDDEARDLYRFRNETRTVETVFLPDDSVEGVATPTDAVLLPFYQAGQERYAIPESRGFTVAVLSPETLAQNVEVTDAELQRAYEEQKDMMVTPETRTLDQAIFTSKDLADKAARSAHDGKSIKDAALGASGDAKSYIGVQKFEKDSLTGEIGALAFAGKKGDIVGPVQTPLGWHVMMIQDIAEPATRSFDDAKAELRAALVADRVGEAAYQASNTLDDQLAGGASLEETAKTLHLELVKIAPVRADGTLDGKKNGLDPLGEDGQALLKSAFALHPGETSPAVQISNNRYAVVRLDQLNEKTYVPFESVKSELAKLWISDQREVLNKRRAGEMLAAFEKDPKRFGADKTFKPQILTLTRQDAKDDAKPASIDPSVKDALFAAEKNRFTIARGENGYYIGRVTAISLPDPAKIGESDLNAIREAHKSVPGQDIFESYLKHLRSQYEVEINQDLLARTYASADPDAAP